MSRQRISITEPNNQWLQSLVERKAYASKSEVVNALIRQAREQQNATDWLRAKLIRAEQNGFTDLSASEILAQAKKEGV